MLTPHTACPDCGQATTAGNWTRCDDCAKRQREQLQRRLADSGDVGGASCPASKEMTAHEAAAPWWGYPPPDSQNGPPLWARDDAHRKGGTKGE